MGKNEQLYDLIPQYVRGELSDEQLRDFTNALKDDNDLVLEVQLEQAAFDVLLDADVLALRAEMENDFNTSKKSHKRKWILGMGLLAVGAGTYFFTANQPQDAQLATPNTNTEKTIVEAIPKEVKTDIVLEKNTLEVLPSSETISHHETPEPQKLTVEETILDDRISPTPVIDTIPEPVIAVTDLTNPKDTAKSLPKDPCVNFKALGTLQTKACNLGEETGVIYTSTELISNGKGPYSYSLDNEYFEEIDEFTDLAAGDYLVYIKDGNNCLATLPVTIHETACNIAYEETFSKSFESAWKVPILIDTPVKITLVNKVGAVLVNKQMQTYDEGVWNGYDDNGNELSIGAYRWIIEYESGEKCIAKMTILN